ncbi:MAG: hypothetical protein PHF50_00265 [Patescibacteria group bacterium]|nr:hypothetical protein [Patescibacteria group bacterium]
MAPIRNVFKAMEYVEDQATPEDNADFEERINRAYEHPNTMEFTRAVDKANELLSAGLTVGKIISRGEIAAKKLCGDLEPDVVAGIMKKIQEIKKIKTME